VAPEVVDHTGLRSSDALRTNMRCPVSLFRYNPEIHDNPEFLPDGAEWARQGGGNAPPTLLHALLSARNQPTSPMFSQLLQTGPIRTAQGINQAQMPEDSFDSPGQPSVTPAQYLGPRLGPFIETLKPGFEFGMDTLGAKKEPLPPQLPKGMTRQDFGDALNWGDEMAAKQWAENLQKNPAAADQFVKEAPKQGITKDMIDQWGNWYGERFRQYPDKEQFWWRSQGLKRLKDRFPSAPPASTSWICPPGWECA
jgi:hypothetical protein